MDSDNLSRYQTVFREKPSFVDRPSQNGSATELSPDPATPPPLPDSSNPSAILDYLRSGHLLIVNGRRKNGVILFKQYHAEFAGPGAAIGGLLDEECQQVLPVGNLSLLQPQTHKERQDAYLIRRQWIRLAYELTEKIAPLQRAQLILNQFETYFDQDTILRVPDDAFALLVGVLPTTIRMARRPPGQFNLRSR
jgi:hypothetical protein